MPKDEVESGRHVLAITAAAGGASIMAIPLGEGSDHLSDWESGLREVEDLRAEILWRYAPRDRGQYLKIDAACHQLSEVLLLQMEQDHEV